MSRWITLEEMCAELRLPHKIVRRLIRDHRLVGFAEGGRNNVKNWRLLEPSEEYSKALNAQERIMSHRYELDLMQFPVISSAELAEMSGLQQSTIRNFVKDGTLKPWKIGRYSVFTPEQVRSFLLLRERKEPTDRRARCELLIRWCLAQLDATPIPTLSEEDVNRDDRLEGALRKIMRQREPARSKHLAEFWRRWNLAQEVAKSIKAASSDCQPEPMPAQKIP